MFVGDESEKTFSNFYYSQIESIDEVKLDYFQKGKSFINSTETRNTFDYCSEAMENFAQSKLAPTQYTTIYDLSSLKIRVYLLHDYTNFVELDLKKELNKGDHQTMIAELFPKESVGFINYEKYNSPEHPTLLIEEFLGDQEITEQEFLDNGLGYEWLNDIKNPNGAIKVFQYGVKLMPNNAKLYENLGEAYYINEDWHNSIKSYAKSLALNPENKNAITMILKISKLKEQQTN